jgi:hypothetical protein
MDRSERHDVPPARVEVEDRDSARGIAPWPADLRRFLSGADVNEARTHREPLPPSPSGPPRSAPMPWQPRAKPPTQSPDSRERWDDQGPATLSTRRWGSGPEGPRHRGRLPPTLTGQCRRAARVGAETCTVALPGGRQNDRSAARSSGWVPTADDRGLTWRYAQGERHESPHEPHRTKTHKSIVLARVAGCSLPFDRCDLGAHHLHIEPIGRQPRDGALAFSSWARPANDLDVRSWNQFEGLLAASVSRSGHPSPSFHIWQAAHPGHRRASTPGTIVRAAASAPATARCESRGRFTR